MVNPLPPFVPNVVLGKVALYLLTFLLLQWMNYLFAFNTTPTLIISRKFLLARIALVFILYFLQMILLFVGRLIMKKHLRSTPFFKISEQSQVKLLIWRSLLLSSVKMLTPAAEWQSRMFFLFLIFCLTWFILVTHSFLIIVTGLKLMISSSTNSG